MLHKVLPTYPIANGGSVNSVLTLVLYAVFILHTQSHRSRVFLPRRIFVCVGRTHSNAPRTSATHASFKYVATHLCNLPKPNSSVGVHAIFLVRIDGASLLCNVDLSASRAS
ncbi:uncharacterized protein BDW43DRAFT_275792 [Aspergillus alliaceus]|uniref:uncharacterized protein n=1 Tax=Petromyces alliaceus TaxID=209559 RepID=UPI0012A4DDE4|nr:uncharacterized protein BDW43DRAFT_275792 [Aspergillus alliaceus]KAB8233670.1 hypothetical protein BDW43DRAFT_275792 [Aspergillus alliaceus]